MLPERLSPSLESYLTQENPDSFQNSLNYKMRQILDSTFSQFHNTLHQTIECAFKKNNQEIRKLEKEISSQRQRAQDYLTTYSYLRTSLECLIKMKNSRPAETAHQAIQSSEDHLLLVDFFKNMFTLLECRECISESRAFRSRNARVCPLPSSRPNTHEVKEPYVDEKIKSKRIIIDANNASNDLPGKDLHTYTPSITATPAKTDLPPKPAKKHFDMRPHRYRRLINNVPHPFHYAKVLNLPKGGLETTQAPRLRRATAVLPYKNPLKKMHFLASVQNIQTVKPIVNSSEYILDNWHVTQLAMYAMQLMFATSLTDSAYKRSDFIFFKDKTVLQGRSAYNSPQVRAANKGIGNQARHMNLTPQSYDLITYTVLKKIKKTKVITPFESCFLQGRQLLDDLSGLKVLYKEFVELILVKQKTPAKLFQEHFSDFTHLSPKKFLLITSVVARTHFEAAANATYDAPSLSNSSDHAIESAMCVQIEKIQKVLLEIVEPKIPSSLTSIQEIPTALVHKQKPIVIDPATPRWKQPKKDWIEMEKDIFPEIQKATKLFDSLYAMMKTYCIDFMTPEDPAHYYTRQKMIQSMNVEEFSALFLHLIEPEGSTYTFIDKTYPDQPDRPTESLRSRPFSEVEHLQIRKQLEEWVEKNCQFTVAETSEEVFIPTPKINELERSLREKRYFKLEYTLLINQSQKITEDVLQEVNTSFQKHFDFVETITPYSSQELSLVYEKDSDENFSARLQELASTFFMKLREDPKLVSKYASPLAATSTSPLTPTIKDRKKKPLQIELPSPRTPHPQITPFTPTPTSISPIKEKSVETTTSPVENDDLLDLFG